MNFAFSKDFCARQSENDKNTIFGIYFKCHWQGFWRRKYIIEYILGRNRQVRFTAEELRCRIQYLREVKKVLSYCLPFFVFPLTDPLPFLNNLFRLQETAPFICYVISSFSMSIYSRATLYLAVSAVDSCYKYDLRKKRCTWLSIFSLKVRQSWYAFC